MSDEQTTGNLNLDAVYGGGEVRIKQLLPIRITINFADGEKMETKIDPLEGAFSFRVQPDCPPITSLTIAAPGSKVEFL